MDSITDAIRRYELLTDELAKCASFHFGAIGDPCFEGFRFYTFERLSGRFAYDEAVELGADAVDEIEGCLMREGSGCSLLGTMLTKLKTVAPALNVDGKTVFLGAWGMGPGEIGWMIRQINSREIFERYLLDAGIGEGVVDLYNDAYARDLANTEARPPNGV